MISIGLFSLRMATIQHRRDRSALIAQAPRFLVHSPHLGLAWSRPWAFWHCWPWSSAI